MTSIIAGGFFYHLITKQRRTPDWPQYKINDKTIEAKTQSDMIHFIWMLGLDGAKKTHN